MDNVNDKLEKKFEDDSRNYRLEKLLDILLQADLKRLDDICAKRIKELSEKKIGRNEKIS